MKRIFLVEDDKEIAKNLTRLLNTEGFNVTHSPTQREAVQMLANNKFDLALVDISLPDGNGFAVCTEIKQSQDIPVIFLTASGDEASVVTGLNMGAEDYITKPFSMKVLIKKIAAVFRRCENRMENGLISYKSVTIDTDGHKVFVNGGLIEVTQKEFELLEELLRNQGRVLTRPQLLDKLWGYDFYGDERIVDSHIKNLRKKLGVNYIDTIRGVGYRIDKEN